MSHCSIYGNYETGSGKVFYVSSGSITCTDCSFSDDQKKYNPNSIKCICCYSGSSSHQMNNTNLIENKEPPARRYS